MKGSNRIGEGELASESCGRRCRTATPLLWSVGKDADHWVPRPSAFSGGNRLPPLAAIGNYGVPEGRTYQSGPRSNIL